MRSWNQSRCLCGKDRRKTSFIFLPRDLERTVVGHAKSDRECSRPGRQPRWEPHEEAELKELRRISEALNRGSVAGPGVVLGWRTKGYRLLGRKRMGTMTGKTCHSAATVVMKVACS